MAKPDPTDLAALQTALSERAWHVCRETVEKGTLTLLDPLTNETRVIDLLSTDKATRACARELLAHIRALAMLTAKRRPRTSPPIQSDGFLLPDTR